MSQSDNEVEDEYSSEKARAEINTPVRSDKNTRRTSGFTGAPVDGNGIMNQEIQTMLQSAKADAKIKGDMFQNIRSSDPNLHKKDPQRSLFGVSYTPTYNENGNMSVENNAANILRSGFTSGFPWANDLAKLHLPKLTKSVNESNSFPNSDVPLINLAILPSKASRIAAIKIKVTAKL